MRAVPGNAPSVLAGAQGGPAQLQVIMNGVYWTTSDGDIMRVPQGGSSAEVVLHESASALAGDASRLYWGGQGGIRSALYHSVPIDPSSVSTLAMVQGWIARIWVDSTGVYFLSRDDGSMAPSRFGFVPLAGGVAKTLTSASGYSAVELDADFIYWITDGKAGALMRMHKAGGAVEALTPVPAPWQSDSLAFDDRWIYFSSGRQVLKWPKL
jgi:hypothetical protein